MPEYAQVQTYVSCNKETFPGIARQLSHVFQTMGNADQRTLEWLSTITWPAEKQDRFVFALHSHSQLLFENTGRMVSAGIGMLFSPASAISGQEEYWMTLDMLFEAERLREPTTSIYKPLVGGMLWLMLQVFAESFREGGVYFTDEMQDGQVWRALVEGRGNLWSFDLALIPKSLSHHFQPVPDHFAMIVLDEAIGLAWRDRWDVLPWEEAEQLSLPTFRPN